MKSRFLLASFLAFSLLFFNAARAAETEPNNTPVTANTLALNGSNSGSITASDVDWFKVTLTGDGKLTLNLTETTGQYVSAQLYDADGITALGDRRDISNGTTSVDIDGLAAGTYYVRIFAYNDGQTPAYSISNVFTTPAQANDAEPDSTKAQALTLPLNGSKTGHIGYYYNNHRDSLDWYKITTTGDGLVKLTLTSANNYYVSARLFDADGVTQLAYVEAANNTSSTTYDGLAAGTYYVQVNAYYNNQFVPYVINDSLFTPAQANDAEPDSTKAQALTLAVNGSATGHIGYLYNNHRDSLDWYKVTTTADGLIKLNLTSANNYYVSARLYDADGTTQLGYVEAANATSSTSVDGLAAGTYYIGINAYYNNQFVPYIIRDSLFTPVQANDAEPDSTMALALPLAVNATTTGHIGYYYNHHSDTLDWYKIVTPANGAIKMTITSNNNYYVSARLFNENGDQELKYVEAANNTTSITTDGLGAGTYYIKINAYYNNQFVPYTLKDSLFTYNPNDTLPNTYFKQAPTIPANRTVTGDVGFLFNTVRDTADTWKINYTGTSGNLNLTFNLLPHIGDGSTNYLWFQVYKDTSASPIFSNYYNTASTAINLTGLTQGYYYIKVFAYYNNEFNAYSIADAFMQVNIATSAVSDTVANPASCGDNSLFYTLAKSHSPYGVQLYRNGVKYDSVNTATDTVGFRHLPAGVYYTTVYGDGATDAAFGKSVTTTFLPPTPMGLSTSDTTTTSIVLHWMPQSCVNSYTLQYHKSGTGTWTTVNLKNDSIGLYKLTGLSVYTEYEWRIAAVDSAQSSSLVSPYSDSMMFITLSNPARIALFRSVQVNACNSDTLKYKASNSVSPYSVQLYRDSMAYGSPIIVTDTAIFAGLPSGVYYAKAHGTGSGDTTGTSGTTTLAPPYPSSLVTDTTTSSAALLTWSPLSCVSYFTLQYKLSTSTTWTDTIIVPADSSSYYLTGLTPSTTYNWRIASVDTTDGHSIVSSYSSSVTFKTMAALPVTLVSFNAKPVNNTVQLGWQTATEINSKYFAVQRSVDGFVFTTVGTVSAFGNSNAQHQYSFTDNSPLRGTNYYRLRQVDIDGRYVDSKTITVSFTTTSLFTLYPNPAVSVVYISLSVAGKSTITVYDNNGKSVIQKVVPDGATSQKINVSSLAAGVYTVVLQQADGRQSLKFVKQ